MFDTLGRDIAFIISTLHTFSPLKTNTQVTQTQKNMLVSVTVTVFIYPVPEGGSRIYKIMQETMVT